MENVLMLSDDVDDGVKFLGNTALAMYENFMNRKVMGERKLEKSCFTNEELAWIYQRGWKNLATVERKCNVGWCREMMANYHHGANDEGPVFMTYFKGIEVVITAARVRDHLGIPEREEEDAIVPDGYVAMEFLNTRFGFVAPGGI